MDIRRKVPDARTIGIRSSRLWMGSNIPTTGNERYLIRQCESPLAMRLALREETDDVVSLLTWASDADAVARFQRASMDFQNGAIEWLTSGVGPIAETILRCVACLERSDAVALGLACGVVFHPSTDGRLERAVGKAEERYFGGKGQEWPTIERWSNAATEVIRSAQVDSKIK